MTHCLPSGGDRPAGVIRPTAYTIPPLPWLVTSEHGLGIFPGDARE